MLLSQPKTGSFVVSNSVALFGACATLITMASVSGEPTNMKNNNNNNMFGSAQAANNVYQLPGVFEGTYSRLGDVNIGGLAIALDPSDGIPALSCSKNTARVSYTSDSTEAIAFAVDLVNRNPQILPNVTLGFVIRGVCWNSPSVALATSLAFLPRVKRERDGSGDGNSSCCYCGGGGGGGGGGDSCNGGCSVDVDDRNCSGGVGFGDEGISRSRNSICNNSMKSNHCNKNCEDKNILLSSSTSPMSSSECSKCLSDDVIGVISPDRDDLTTSISSLYSVAHLPIIGGGEVGDDLSNKKNHPYFFRMAPPQHMQNKAILRFLSSNGWSYISIIYQEGHYGQSAYKSMDRHVTDYGICIAASHMLEYRTDYDEIIADLMKYPRARVVVLFMDGSRLRKVLRGVKNNNATGHFIFVASDLAVSYSGYAYYGTADDPAIGIFVFDIYFEYAMEFYDYLRRQNVATTRNPWLRGAFEYIMECSYDTNQTEINICKPERNIFQTYRYRTNKATSLRIDGVLTFAHALDNLLRDKCPDVARPIINDVRACINGPLLREYLRNVSFDGYNGRIEFDANQDVEGKYVIGQFVYDYRDYPFTTHRRFKHMTVRQIGVYDYHLDSISYHEDKPIDWSHIQTVDRIVPLLDRSSSSSFSNSPNSSASFSANLTNTNTSTVPSPPPFASSPSSSSSSSSSPFLFPSFSSLPPEIPESVCSRPCVVGEYNIEKDVPCCWECRTCRENERLVNENTGCEACPKFTWPDKFSEFSKCVDIPPTYPSFDATIQLTLISIAIICLIIGIFAFIAFIVYRDRKVIKASSRDLSAIQLIAILIGDVTVILYQAKPSDVMCMAIYMMFCMSFALLYCPLLVKTIRIYRIFNLGVTLEKPRLVSNRSQLSLSACLVTIQLILCAADYIYYDGCQAKLTHPIWTEKFVELSCDMTFPGLASFLVYNILQLALCSIFAFKVRQLPDNFNESRFITMCVSTTLLIWLAFVPTYYTAQRENVRTFLLSTSLLLNHSVALIFLYLPKIYAAKFLSEPDHKSSSTFFSDTLNPNREMSSVSTVRSGLQSFSANSLPKL